MNKVFIIGGGASGMTAAIFASDAGMDVTLFEKNEKLGKKIYITGKGRCNVTNCCDRESFFENVVVNEKFLYSSFSALNNYDVMDMLESNGLRLKVERGNRVFPESDHASDVTKTLTKMLNDRKVNIKLNTEVTEILVENNKNNENDSDDSKSKEKTIEKVRGIKLKNGQTIECDRIILCTGGVSYPSTGSDGFGIEEAKRLGIKVTDINPGLVPFNTKEEFVKDMQGLALKNVEARVLSQSGKLLYQGFGEMLFTHFGVSGPLMISASSYVTDYIKNEPLKLHIDLKPAIDREQLDKRLLKIIDENKNKQFKNILNGLLPQTMLPVIVKLSGIDPEKQSNQISKNEREALLKLLKEFPLTLSSFRGLNEAIITRGGISVKEINPKTMESKKIKGLFFAGELIDVDALTGGFNLQIAWSTGCAAGKGSAL